VKKEKEQEEKLLDLQVGKSPRRNGLQGLSQHEKSKAKESGRKCAATGKLHDDYVVQRGITVESRRKKESSYDSPYKYIPGKKYSRWVTSGPRVGRHRLT